MQRAFLTLCRLNIQSIFFFYSFLPPPLSYLYSPSPTAPTLSAPRWPDVPKRKRKNSQCSVKSMSGKDLSHLLSPLRGLVTSKQTSEHNSKQVSFKMFSLLMCWGIWTVFSAAHHSSASFPGL